jgi:hypothetical protein
MFYYPAKVSNVDQNEEWLRKGAKTFDQHGIYRKVGHLAGSTCHGRQS